MFRKVEAARAGMIADGANEMLAIRGAGSLIDPARLRMPATDVG